jgi:predicted lipoprotein
MEKVGDVMGKANNLSSLSGITVNSNNTVNSIDKSIKTVNSKETVDSDTVNSGYPTNGKKSLAEEIEILIQEHGAQPEGIAQHLAEMLKDTKSVNYYLILVKKILQEHYYSGHTTQKKWIMKAKFALIEPSIFKRY